MDKSLKAIEFEKNIIKQQFEMHMHMFKRTIEIAKKSCLQFEEERKSSVKFERQKDRLLFEDLYDNSMWEEVFLEVTNVIEQEMAAAYILSLYGSFENTVFKLCKIYETYSENIKVEYIKGKGIKKYTTYLKCIGLNQCDKSKYADIINWNEIRNIIIHNGMLIKEKEIEKFSSYVEIDSSLEFQHNIIVDFNTVHRLLNTIEEYTYYLFSLSK